MTTRQSPVLARASAHLCQADFDPANVEHMKAFDLLVNHGRQHPTLRFRLEQPYLDIRSMMQAAVCKAYITMFTSAASTRSA